MPPTHDLESPARRRAAFVARLLILAALYWVAGRVGLSLTHYHENASLFWPPTGLALAALVLYGPRMWPGVFLGVLLLTSGAWLPSLGIAVGNTLEAVVGSLLLRRVHFRPNLERVRDVVGFLVFGVLACTMVSASIGVGVLSLLGMVSVPDVGTVWLIWWLGDVGGAVVVAPVLMVGRYGSPPWRELAATPEAWLVLGCVAGGSLLAFSGFLSGPGALLAAFFPFPFLVWAGGRLGPRGAVGAALAISGTAVVGTTLGHGPFAVEGTHTSAMLLWAYGIAVGTAALTLAAAIAQRELAERRYRAEEKGRLLMERRMNEAQRLESLGLLAGGVAHDFNNILTVVLSNTELLEARLRGDSESLERLHSVEEASRRAADLCGRLLDYAGRQRPEKRPILLSRVAEEACALVAPSMVGRVTLEIAGSADELPVEGDPTLLQQVAMNLVLNAAEAIGERSGRVEIEVGRSRLEAHELARMTGARRASPGWFGFLEVRDTGSGMDAATRDRIFDPFFSTRLEGRGLGLASALGIVQSHEGAIEIQSEIGRGSCFRVYVPASVSAIPAPEPGRRPRRPDGEGRLVLLAEDEPEVRNVVVEVLQGAGYRTLAVSDGFQAVEEFRSSAFAFDAVLLDVTMPRMSGIEALAEIRALDARVPVVLMSGYEAAVSSMGPEPSAFLHKPFSKDDLIEKLGGVLD